jgi:hypothetical protein
MKWLFSQAQKLPTSLSKPRPTRNSPRGNAFRPRRHPPYLPNPAYSACPAIFVVELRQWTI